MRLAVFTVAPQVIDELLAADHAGDHRPTMGTDPHLQRGPARVAEPTDHREHIEGAPAHQDPRRQLGYLDAQQLAVLVTRRAARSRPRGRRKNGARSKVRKISHRGAREAITTRATGDVLVASQNQAAYFVFSQNGVFKKQVAVNCIGQLRNIAADGQAVLYIGCYEANKVVIFDAADLPIKELPISSPAGIAVLPAMP